MQRCHWMVAPGTVYSDLMATQDLRSSMLIEVDELADIAGTTGVAILDVTTRLTRELSNTARSTCFEVGHIPGSVSFDVGSAKGVLSAKSEMLPWMWPSTEEVTSSLRAAGVHDGDRIVIAASTPRAGIDSGTMWCTRAFWTLHHMGLNVAVLRGGLESWIAAGHPLETGDVAVEPSDIVVSDTGLHGRALIDDVIDALGDGSTCLIDALSSENYNGLEPGYGPRRGHISGAVNVPYLNLIDAETALFPSNDELAERLASVRGGQSTIAYCGGAIAATVVAFALTLLGETGIRVYDGSLMEWSTRDDLPMTNPSA